MTPSPPINPQAQTPPLPGTHQTAAEKVYEKDLIFHEICGWVRGEFKETKDIVKMMVISKRGFEVAAPLLYSAVNAFTMHKAGEKMLEQRLRHYRNMSRIILRDDHGFPEMAPGLCDFSPYLERYLWMEELRFCAVGGAWLSRVCFYESYRRFIFRRFEALRDMLAKAGPGARLSTSEIKLDASHRMPALLGDIYLSLLPDLPQITGGGTPLRDEKYGVYGEGKRFRLVGLVIGKPLAAFRCVPPAGTPPSKLEQVLQPPGGLRAEAAEKDTYRRELLQDLQELTLAGDFDVAVMAEVIKHCPRLRNLCLHLKVERELAYEGYDDDDDDDPAMDGVPPPGDAVNDPVAEQVEELKSLLGGHLPGLNVLFVFSNHITKFESLPLNLDVKHLTLRCTFSAYSNLSLHRWTEPGSAAYPATRLSTHPSLRRLDLFIPKSEVAINPMNVGIMLSRLMPKHVEVNLLTGRLDDQNGKEFKPLRQWIRHAMEVRRSVKEMDSGRKGVGFKLLEQGEGSGSGHS